MEFGLEDQVISKICSVLRQNKSVEKIIIYGSRAKGSFRMGSDIDLVLIGPNLSTSDLLKLENELDELLLPYKIDHIDRVGKNFNPSFFHQKQNS
jgi:predicted nucleotidyltransferase